VSLNVKRNDGDTGCRTVPAMRRTSRRGSRVGIGDSCCADRRSYARLVEREPRKSRLKSQMCGVPEIYSRAGGTEYSAYEKRTGEFDTVRRRKDRKGLELAKCRRPNGLRLFKRRVLSRRGFLPGS
jgi:hypothetical protein